VHAYGDGKKLKPTASNSRFQVEKSFTLIQASKRAWKAQSTHGLVQQFNPAP
jgi:hypothetical protein